MRRRLGTRPSAWCALALAVLFAGASPAGAAQLRAGAATADITPASGGTTLGFVRPDITVKGVHTRLMGRVLVLDDGDTRVALLSTDLAFALDKDGLVARVADLGYTHETIMYTGTHTHSGPGDLAGWQVAQLAKAIRTAHGRLAPARAGWAMAAVGDVNRNRSVEAHLANHGMDHSYGAGHPEDDPRGADHTRDTTLRVLRVEHVDGRPLAAWMEFPVHLTTSTAAVDVWDADLAGAAEHHLERGVARVGRDAAFVALWTNGASGDLMPRFDAYNATATMDLLGRRIATQARNAWRSAGRRLRRTLPIDVRWTRSCYCGQEVEPARRVSDTPYWGLPFLGGSEDGASIFHEPLATEGRRLPAESADPVHGRKIVVAVPTTVIGVHEVIPEVQVIRVGDRLLLASPGEPSVEMARRFEAAVRPHLPAGVLDIVNVGLANDYLGYLTTPEEYDVQHYEGGHTVFGKWTSLLARDTFVSLTQAMAAGRPAAAPAAPATLGSTTAAEPAVGNGGVAGQILEAPSERAERMSVVGLRFSGAPGGVDRPADRPFVSLERDVAGTWLEADSDLGLGVEWRETDGTYDARYDIPPDLPAGRYRLRATSGSYDLPANAFDIVASDDLRPLGVLAQRLRRGRTRLVLRAQNPPPDPARSILFRPRSPEGGRAVLRVAGRRVRARWSSAYRGWTVVVKRRVRPGGAVTLAAGALRDGAGNTNGDGAALKAGELAEATWPPNMGVGGGRTPGPGGEGSFPP